MNTKACISDSDLCRLWDGEVAAEEREVLQRPIGHRPGGRQPPAAAQADEHDPVGRGCFARLDDPRVALDIDLDVVQRQPPAGRPAAGPQHGVAAAYDVLAQRQAERAEHHRDLLAAIDEGGVSGFDHAFLRHLFGSGG